MRSVSKSTHLEPQLSQVDQASFSMSFSTMMAYEDHTRASTRSIR